MDSHPDTLIGSNIFDGLIRHDRLLTDSLNLGLGILPPGQGSILAVGASQPQLVANEDNMFGIRQKMQVNMTCDHRIIYGAHAAAFLQDLAKLIQRDPQSLTM